MLLLVMSFVTCSRVSLRSNITLRCDSQILAGNPSGRTFQKQKQVKNFCVSVDMDEWELLGSGYRMEDLQSCSTRDDLTWWTAEWVRSPECLFRLQSRVIIQVTEQILFAERTTPYDWYWILIMSQGEPQMRCRHCMNFPAGGSNAADQERIWFLKELAWEMGPLPPFS